MTDNKRPILVIGRFSMHKKYKKLKTAQMGEPFNWVPHEKPVHRTVFSSLLIFATQMIFLLTKNAFLKQFCLSLYNLV